MIAGAVNLVLLPFTFVLVTLHTFFRYGMVRKRRRAVGGPSDERADARGTPALLSAVCGWRAVLHGCARLQEFRVNPEAAGARQYTPMAKMRLREFNEYPHVLERRWAAPGASPAGGRWGGGACRTLGPSAHA